MATVQRIDPTPSGNGQGGFITGAVVLGAVALQFVPGLDIAVDAAAAATGGGAALEGAAAAAGGTLARAAGTTASTSAIPLAKKIGALFFMHGKSLAREVAIGTVADAIIHPPGHEKHEGDATAQAIAACSSGDVKSAHIKDSTGDVTIVCK